ncbi:uncharacterized protein LOC129605956 [Condylostylus longicornis]|uniref:uncharacterized protein LOC129605956 n=1 Tax=Condylostylus longicornis TaxID=2530218 RepID=UPI00244E19BF|nr:uncharacterized protein LOC129605956 [Condylostylus longicornis]
MDTKYGLRILANFKKFGVFLPIRFNKLTDDNIDKLKTGYGIVNKGQFGRTFDVKFVKSQLKVESEEEDDDDDEQNQMAIESESDDDELFCKYVKPQTLNDGDDGSSCPETDIKSFMTRMKLINLERDIENFLIEDNDRIQKLMDEFQERDSGWALSDILHLEVNINKYEPISGSSFSHSDRTSSYNIMCNINREIILLNEEISLNFTGLQFPMKVDDIYVFENLNPNISINVFGLDENSNVIGPYYHTKLIKRRIYMCSGCLLHFNSQSILEKHKHECNKIVTRLPTKESEILKFKNYYQQLDVPFVIYADSECILEKIQGCQQNLAISSTTDIELHTPIAFSYFIKCSFDSSLDKYRNFKGENCADDFLKNLIGDCSDLFENYILKKKPMIPLTKEQITQNLNTKVCHICEEEIELEDDEVYDHCHLTGKFRGISHNKCNLSYNLNCVHGSINVIPLNKEKYFSLSKSIKSDYSGTYFTLRFLDSFRFLGSSLDSLGRNLEDSQLINVRNHYPDNIKFNLMKNKGIFPYSYVDSLSKLNEKMLPPEEAFKNQILNSECSDLEYLHAKKVWETFNCLAWQAILKYTKVELELLTDIEMIKFFQKGIRGGICQCSCRHSKANNKYMDDFNTEIDSQYLFYCDANNLYGWAMSTFLPTGSFKWVNDFSNIDILNTADNSQTGYVLEVDLKYPFELHDKHNDLPFCAENKIPPIGKLNKLLTDLTDKKKYIIHYRTLKQCLKNGLILEHIHRVTEKHVEKRKLIKIATSWESEGKRLGARALIARKNFHSISQFTEGLAAIQLDKMEIFYDKPIYLGFSILEQSKILMYDFHYEYMIPKFGENVKINYMDTDSFVYTIKTDDFYEDIYSDILETSPNKLRFDTSDSLNDFINFTGQRCEFN